MIAAVVSVLLAGLAALAVLGVMRRPLLAVLTELCMGEQRAQFWWRVVTIEVIAGTALCMSVAMLLVPHAAPWRWVVITTQGSVAGLLVSLVAVMAAVAAFQRARDSA